MITNELLAQGRIIRDPVGPGPGYWVGCPGAFFDEIERAWYLTYRVRRPRGVAPDRGGEVRIARSTDLERWEDVLSIAKDRYDSASIERSCLLRGKDGVWRYFTSYVHPADGRWCTTMFKAPRVAELNPANRKVIFSGPPLGLEGVKDPWILEHEGMYYLFLSIATPTPKTGEGSHTSLDIFNTGECKSATGLAVSRDLERWDWQGSVFAPGASGWDQYCRRINSVAKVDAGHPGDSSSGAAGRPAKFIAFYDGSASHLENYEEKCGLAVSNDLRHWEAITPQKPMFTSPHASTSLRYIDAKFVNGTWHLFYEFARPDGAHDMRLVTCSPAALEKLAG
jgi:hypothetical protein